MIRIGCYEVGMLPTNTYFLYREGGTDCVVVDPADHGGEIYASLCGEGLSVRAILLTHGHFDHIWGVEELRKLSGAPVCAWEKERRLLSDPQLNESASCGRPCTVAPDRWFRDGESFTFAGIGFTLLGTPGHTEGSCCYYVSEEGLLLSGDTLFQLSVGRTDLPTGSMSELVRSIRSRLYGLPEKTRVFPGHGPETDIGTEMKFNSYLA
ncbi:MBL fold metallo-hydrolase [Lachnoclostridium sp. Marseille-P6806]|uniref:MBL fold metallo-hydrolase n=1 Tax=Lachnoclostridium sp. Marseille-P6806 TaxID=2364793 RepID=UPI001F5E5334|nr:MBL fold metallo-hydrolase [Lachnoclostridium sp. Marseille-P6806]